MKRLYLIFTIVWAMWVGPGNAQSGPYRVVIIPKLVGIDYYDAVKKGIDEADAQLPDLEVIWTGPTQALVESQIDIIESRIPSKPDLIAVAANDPVRIVPILRKASAAGIRIMSWDGDSDFREFFVNLVDYDEFGARLTNSLVGQIGPQADIAVVTTTFTAPNQVRWLQAIKAQIYNQYPALNILDIRPAMESTERSYRITRQYIREFPSLKGIIALGVPNVPGVVQALEDEGLAGRIAVVGNATPNLTRSFLKKGYMKEVHLWNAPDHGYLTVYAAHRLLSGDIGTDRPFKAGRLGSFTPQKDEISSQVALPVMVFTPGNIDRFHF